ncbi:MAG: hypothetical protein LBS31_06505 [Candidatus Adiutrix sp.]|jgi:DNA-binding NtrC family response regulator|nr:hypothetical protein [Candidatus Adiutrix sp.]
MRVIIVGRDKETIAPLVDKLTTEDFEVIVVENSVGVLSFIKKKSIQFLLADSNYLVSYTLSKQVLSRCPLARLIVLASRPSLVGMSEAISAGLADYFPRRYEYFDEVVHIAISERARLMRWQRTFLLDAPMPLEDDAVKG